MILGTTYSHRHAAYLHLPEKDTLKELFTFGFDVVRLGCYWDELHPEQSRLDFSRLETLLELFSQHRQKVVLTVGMKAPRWPEYYVPSWISDAKLEKIQQECLIFIEQAVTKLKRIRCIAYWQVENEPLDPAGPQKLTMPLDFLKQEVSLVKKLDNRPVIITAWGNEVKKRKTFAMLSEISDVLGLDIYFKVPFGKYLFFGPRNYPNFLQQQIARSQKPVWISELQAEPWESGDVLQKGAMVRTISDELLKRNYQSVKALNPEAILFWGYEYWYLKRMQGEVGLWNTAKQIVEEEKER